MKKYLLPLSCLFLTSACLHTGKTPDWTPSEDIPPGTYVLVTLQDAGSPQRRSTYVVDPRMGTVVERRDGKRAYAVAAPQSLDTESTGEAVQAALVPTSRVTVAMSVNCRETLASPDGCVDLAIDPKHETSGDPNPIKDEKQRIAITERYVKQLAVNVLQTARRAGVQVHVPALKRPAK
ncbi:hypothetical protein [Myxococcus xanthus]|uniref:Lipoprotein n=1 Tax=Myxococcus xanthus TaxID=34 RepID=A0A7Y4IJQ7_MYXXA|nr:hypothetical protein [Myxococcus xanthus]NOJ80508.1 hypothetical protein [Myxococcus xanthus]NOJ84373.1 hypothetical protein [Myxococcus xanthus]